jgi:hypothetical protein
MKKTKITYWIITGLFAAFMLLSAIPDILMSADAVTFIIALGYPRYFIPFIGVAKLLGAIAIVVPGFPRIREWAYAGLIFDLIGAAYSNLSVGASLPETLPIFLAMAVGFASYWYNNRMVKTSTSSETALA